ncbi:MAG TPA: hypothetical protein VGV64_07785 [Thermoplasmata archaeon]|nr:hypothetical protein [Thermoplasmata archaeon]
MARILRSHVCASCRSPIRVVDLREFLPKPWATAATLSCRRPEVPPLIGSVSYCPIHGAGFVPIRIFVPTAIASTLSRDPEEAMA